MSACFTCDGSPFQHMYYDTNIIFYTKMYHHSLPFDNFLLSRVVALGLVPENELCMFYTARVLAIETIRWKDMHVQYQYNCACLCVCVTSLMMVAWREQSSITSRVISVTKKNQKNSHNVTGLVGYLFLCETRNKIWKKSTNIWTKRQLIWYPCGVAIFLTNPAVKNRYMTPQSVHPYWTVRERTMTELSCASQSMHENTYTITWWHVSIHMLSVPLHLCSVVCLSCSLVAQKEQTFDPWLDNLITWFIYLLSLTA